MYEKINVEKKHKQGVIISTRTTNILNKKICLVYNYLLFKIYLKDNATVAANSRMSR